jgi:hypothetical protein
MHRISNVHQCTLTFLQCLIFTLLAMISQDIFSEFEDRAFKHLITSIEAQKDRAVQEILKSFLKKIHRRKK